MGELSRELEKGAGNQHTVLLSTTGKKHKSAVLAEAGISIGLAHRAEKVAAVLITPICCAAPRNPR